MKRSDRYKSLVGRLCPNCQRPAAYIERIGEGGKESSTTVTRTRGAIPVGRYARRRDIAKVFDRR